MVDHPHHHAVRAQRADAVEALEYQPVHEYRRRPACPTVIPTQYHRGSGTFATASTPVTTTTVNAAMPISGFGKPSADACGVVITEPHDTIGLMLQDGT